MRVVSVRTLSSGRGRNRKVEFVRGKCATKTPSAEPAIRVSEAALAHIKKLREEAGGDELLLRVGVKEGGCSGMSYTMDFEKEESVLEEDSTLEYGDMKIVCDPKSLLYLYGMELDYKSALIGGSIEQIVKERERIRCDIRRSSWEWPMIRLVSTKYSIDLIVRISHVVYGTIQEV